MSRRQPTNIVNVDFWADRIAALIKLAEHYGMTVEIVGGELVVSRQVSDVFIARTEVQWREAPDGDEAQQQPETRPGCTCPHPADEHSVYGCADGCGCEWMPKRPPVEPAPAKVAERCGCPDEGAIEHQFGGEDCTCIPFTRQDGTPRYCQPGDTVDMIAGWERGRDCPHHAPAVVSAVPPQPEETA